MNNHHNVFRVCADLVHLLAFFLLIGKMFVNQSCAGISGKTQILITTVFTLRYLDLWTTFISVYNTGYKIFYIALSLFILYLIFHKFRKTYDCKNDSFLAMPIILTVLFVLTLCLNYIILNTVFIGIPELFWIYISNPLELTWTFSIYLEALAIIPQLHMIRKTGDGQTVLPYILALTVYRGLYVCNWIYRYFAEDHLDLISSVSGTLQTALLVIVLINIQLYKERKPKWQEITEVFTVEDAKLGESKKLKSGFCINQSQN